MVKEYNLPYEIPERDNKVLILSRTMKGKGGGGGTTTSKPKRFTQLKNQIW